MPSAPALELQLNRSAWQRRLLAVGYAVAAIAWLAAGLHWSLTVLGLVALATGLWRDTRGPWPRRLGFRPGGGWRVIDSRQTVLKPGRLRLARAGRFVTSITWRAGPGHSLALFDDAFCDTGHKRLRRLLRHSDTSAPC